MMDRAFDQRAASAAVKETIAEPLEAREARHETARAEAAYIAYGEVTGGKNHQGLPMPLWSELPELIQDAWRAAAKKAAQYA